MNTPNPSAVSGCRPIPQHLQDKYPNGFTVRHTAYELDVRLDFAAWHPRVPVPDWLPTLRDELAEHEYRRGVIKETTLTLSQALDYYEFIQHLWNSVQLVHGGAVVECVFRNEVDVYAEQLTPELPPLLSPELLAVVKARLAQDGPC